MKTIIAFYAWQSDTPPDFDRTLIEIALQNAASRINENPSSSVEIKIDSDTQGVPGPPPITETILKKIEACDLFIPDLTFVAKTADGKYVPYGSPNGCAIH